MLSTTIIRTIGGASSNAKSQSGEA